MKSDWVNLPTDLLDSILERMPTESDLLPFSRACKSWQYVAEDNLRKRSKPPLLLIPTDKEGVWNFYNMEYDKVLDLQLRLPYKRFCGSSKGWLIFVEEDFSISLLNPFSKIEGREEKENSIIRLPQLAARSFGQKDYAVYKAMMSSDPISDANDCIVVVIYEDLCRMAFLRLGKDTKWTYLDRKWEGMEEVILFRDKFYAVHVDRLLVNFDASRIRHVNWLGGYMSDRRWSCGSKYLVSVDDKELLLVYRYIMCKSGNQNFGVFKWNFDLGKWIEKKTLGGIALFIGDNSSVCVLAPSQNCWKYIKPNYIYFNFRCGRYGSHQLARNGHAHEYGVYDYANRCILEEPPYNTCAKKLMDMAKRPAIWVDIPTNLYAKSKNSL